MRTGENHDEAGTPPTPGVRGVRLRTSANVRTELAATYRAYRQGEIDAQSARTRGFLLQTLAGVIRDEMEIEKLAAIEAQIAELQREVGK